MPESDGEVAFRFVLRSLNASDYEREFRFAPPRLWRFDFAFPDRMLAVEIEGGTWSGGRHVRGAGYERDLEKYNRAVLMGWRVLRFTTGMVDDGTAREVMEEALCA